MADLSLLALSGDLKLRWSPARFQTDSAVLLRSTPQKEDVVSVGNAQRGCRGLPESVGHAEET
jgi:hypothetical protein